MSPVCGTVSFQKLARYSKLAPTGLPPSTAFYRGPRKKALSNLQLTFTFSFQIALDLLVKECENLTFDPTCPQRLKAGNQDGIFTGKNFPRKVYETSRKTGSTCC